jgi:hypothetical protein
LLDAPPCIDDEDAALEIMGRGGAPPPLSDLEEFWACSWDDEEGVYWKLGYYGKAGVVVLWVPGKSKSEAGLTVAPNPPDAVLFSDSKF